MNDRDYILSFILESSAGEGKINRLIAGAKKALRAKDFAKADDMMSKVFTKRDNRKQNRAKRYTKYFLGNSKYKTVFER